MANNPPPFQQMNSQGDEDSSGDQRYLSSDNMSAGYSSSSGHRQRPLNQDGFDSSRFAASQQAQGRSQEALPHRQNYFRPNPNVMPNSGAFEPWSDSTPSQAGSDSYISGSTLSSHTPSSPASSQPHQGHGKSSAASHGPFATQKQRFWLYIRQQPRAGRACSNGRDRRAIDPPPVVQLQITDFDPNSPDDMEDMQDQYFIVHCLLREAAPPGGDVSVIMCEDDNSSASRAEKQINGSLDASPFFCEEDPDPSTAPPHPSSQLYYPQQTRPSQVPRRNLPATFFYFADLSIRKAGVYRLEFQLMRMRMDGQPVPILHTVLSEPFNVVNAKDFDHVQPSTPLVRGLLASHAGFPLKLKQGSRARRESPEE